jgi:hypothetical protein
MANRGSKKPLAVGNDKFRALPPAEQLDLLQLNARALYKIAEHEAGELGRALLRVRERMAHGQFKAWWTQAGMKQARVSYAMRLAEGKVGAAKERLTATPRAKALRSVGGKLAELYDLAEAGKQQHAQKLFDEIVDEIKLRFMASLSLRKPAAKAARAS